MKPFIFDNQEYHDLDALGVAFANHFDLALQAIQEKSFLKFVKHFKKQKNDIKKVLYESRYIQNALSIIIYKITEEHIFYVGHKRYYSIEACLKDIRKNQAIVYFAEDHGFSNTILSGLEDEKLKADLVTFENEPKDEVALDLLEKYFEKDSIEPLRIDLQRIFSSSDPFKLALQEFKSQKNQLALAQRYSLKDVIELRKSNCPVFKGLSILKEFCEEPWSMFDQAFYMSLLGVWKSCKFKGSAAKGLKRKIKDYSKAYKKISKMSYSQKMHWYERFHTLYLEWVDYFKLDKVIMKDSMDEPCIPYCDTYVSEAIKEERGFPADSVEKPYEPCIKPEYDLRQLENSIRNHGFFVYWSILLLIIYTVLYVIIGLLPVVKGFLYDTFTKMLKISMPKETFDEITNFSMLIHILFFVGIGISFILGCVILILRFIAKRRYKGLCNLAYYRKNESILKEKEQEEYEKLKTNEAKYAKSIDRFYRFYGGISNAGLSLAITIFTVLFVLLTLCFINESYALKVNSLLKDKIYFIAVPPVVCMLLGFARHKKTSISAILTYIFSFFLSIGLIVLSIVL